jgi:hypothetical protein
MKKKYLLLLIVFNFSCNSPDVNLGSIDPSKFVNNKITLSDIAEDINYIPLDNQFPIQIIYSLKILNNSIVLAAQNNGVIVFNRSGELTKKIGNIGRGPNEYTYFLSFAVDEKLGTIYVMDNKSRKIVVYSKNGIFLRNIPLEKYGSYNQEIDFYNSKLFVSDYIIMGQAKTNWMILDTLGNLIKVKENSIQPFSSRLGIMGGTYKFENRINYWNCYNDTIFSILPDLNYKAQFLFSAGPNRLPRFDADNIFKYVLPCLIFETNHFFVFEYGFNKKGQIALIDKKSKKSFLSEWDPDNGIGIPNDLDGGVMFIPNSYFVEGGREYIVGLFYPYQLKIHVKSEAFKNSSPKYPKKKLQLEKMANSLNENDNPVLMLVKLKE